MIDTDCYAISFSRIT